MSESRWRTKSRAVIIAALGRGRKAGLDGKELEKYVSEAYPFGERRMYPYRVWLNEFALLVKNQRKPMVRIKFKSPVNSGSWPGLFDLGNIPIGREPLPGQTDFLEGVPSERNTPTSSEDFAS